MRSLQAEDAGPAVATASGPAAAVPTTVTVETSPSAVHAADLSLARAAVETVVRVGLMLALAGWCLWITRPFIFALIWGIIIAVAINPGFQRLKALLGGRGGLAAALMASSILVVLVWPVSMLTSSLIANLSELAIRLMDGSLRLPPPPAGAEQWPLIGPKIEQLWTMGSAGLGSVVEEIQPQLRVAAGWLLSVVADLGLGLLHFVAAMIIAGILLAHAEGGHRLASDLATRLVGARGPGLAALAERTIRGVARGVIGTALVQSAAAGVGFMVAGVPWAALLVLLCFLLCLVQIGPAPVL
ncbi:MAG TPA: AI-2E family transporter, partial [Geminicoccus sp.]|uniref:AI-2E family transporter n=1 Tax=Geminicoccus sp. TaxID=2024832 RepID=UPI002E35497A